MKMYIGIVFLVFAATATALVAGLFYGYCVSVNPGLKALSDSEYLKTMQSINRAILNPYFFVCFLGAVLLLPVVTYIEYTSGLSLSFWLLLGATLLYITGVFGVTVLGNVPLNEALDRVNLQQAALHELTDQRVQFEKSWNRLHAIRTAASILSFILVFLSTLMRTCK